MMLIVIQLVCFIISIVNANRIEQIVNYEHWQDIQHFQDNSRVGRVPGVCAFYDSNICNEKMEEFRRLSTEVPDRRMFIIGEYEVTKNPNQTWYEWSDDYDFAKAFNVSIDETNCPQILFFPMGKHAKKQPVYYDADNDHVSMRDWIWDHLHLRNVPIYNALDEPIKIYWHRKGNPMNKKLTMTLEAGEHRTQDTYISHIFTAESANDNRFIGGFEVSHRTTYVLDDNDEATATKEWFHNYNRKKRIDAKYWNEMIWSHTRRHLYNMKIPMMLPKFTRLGYKKVTLPRECLDMLHAFYEQNRNKSKVENWPRGGTQVNFDVVRTKMIYLPHNMKLRVAKYVQPLLEQWSGTRLKFETMYGLREYFNGSILRNHVDRIETHVVSAIINVHEDLNEDWQLELIDFNGKKVHVTQHPGELVMYESATLIHGRPKALNGRVYASGFIHFYPIRDWTGKYKTTSDNVIVTPKQRLPLYPVYVQGDKFVGSNPYHLLDSRSKCSWPYIDCDYECC